MKIGLWRTITFLIAYFVGAALAQADPQAGPHLTGNEYVALRGTAPAPAIKFTMVVKTKGETERREITLGPDYIVERGPRRTAIFDFRFERLLLLNEQQRTFSNMSLFGHFRTRFALLQNNLGVVGSGIAAGLIENDRAASVRFVTEHANGIRFPRPVAFENLPEPALNVINHTDFVLGTLAGANIFTVRFDNSTLPTPRHRKTLLAWLAWAGIVHPNIAQAITRSNKMPKHVDIEFPADLLKMSPNVGATTQITFEHATLLLASLVPLGDLATMPPAWPPYMPESLAKLMISAARGTAPGGPRPDDEFISEIGRLSAAGQHVDAVLLGLHASHPYDGCQGLQASHAVCQALLAAGQRAQEDQNVRRLLDGFAASKRGEYAQSVQILLPLRSLPLERPDILEIIIANGVIEAKNTSHLDAPLTEEFARLPQTFERALAADPYDPARYRDIFNFMYAAAANLEESYQARTQAQTVIDLAQVLPNRRTPAIISQIAAQNAQIAADFPILFPFTDR